MDAFKELHKTITNRDQFGPCETINFILTLFRLNGYWRPDRFDQNLPKKILYHAWGVVWISWYILLIMYIQIMACIKYYPDLIKVTGALFVFSSFISHVLRVMNLIYRRDMMANHFQYYRRIMDEHIATGDVESRSIIQRYELLQFTQLIIFASGGTLTCISWAFAGDPSGNEWGFPLVVWYPFDTSYSPVYEVVYAHLMLATLFAALHTIGSDLLNICCMCQVSCQVALLKKNLCDITADGEGTFTQLKGVLTKHAEILQICSELDLTVGWPTFSQFGFSCTIVCISLLQLANDNANESLASKLPTLIYTATMVFQLFMYCYNGNELYLIHQSIAASTAEIPWYTFPLNCRKVLIVMIAKSQQPVIIRAGRLIPLDNETFKSIIKSAYSFFSVIKNSK